MNYNELKEQIISEANIANIIENLVNFNYVPLMSQNIIIDNIRAISLQLDENGFLKKNHILYNTFMLIYIIDKFTDIELPTELYDESGNINFTTALEVYDFFKEYRLNEFIYNQYFCKDFINLLEEEVKQELETNNSTSYILSQALKTFMEKIPTQQEIGQLLSSIPEIAPSKTKPKKSATTRKQKES